jgi:pyruvate ferredoxin oxidoreductase gamma subunit
LPKGHVLTVPASELALKHVGRPLPNAALLGAFSALTGMVHMKSVAAAIADAFGAKIAQANIAAATAAYEAVAPAAAA